MAEPPFQNQDVADRFAAYPAEVRPRLLELRALIFKVAAEIPGVGALEETLKWGQPSYLTPESQSGTTVRIDADATSGGDYALYVNCRTSLVDDWRNRFPNLGFSGTRALTLNSAEPMPEDELAHCIGMALTYHARKRSRGPSDPS